MPSQPLYTSCTFTALYNAYSSAPITQLQCVYLYILGVSNSNHHKHFLTPPFDCWAR
jgi:hypothetical protein